MPLDYPEEEGKLIIQAEDTLIGKQRRIPVDMVILSAGLEPRHDSKALAKTFGISCSADGWFIERHPKLDPVATMTEGVYIAGCVQGPKDIPASVVQGAAAAARILGKIQQKEIALEPVRATVNAGYSAPAAVSAITCAHSTPSSSTKTRWSSEVNPALCQGCGTCVAACPAGAISWNRLPNEQILSQIDGLLLLNISIKKEAAAA